MSPSSDAPRGERRSSGPADLEEAVHSQWLAAQAGYREPSSVFVYSLAIVAVGGLGLLDAGRAVLGPAPGALVATLGVILMTIWGAAIAYHTAGVESALYKAADLVETLALQSGSLLIVAMTPDARSIFWLVYLGHMSMLPAEPPGRRLVNLVVQGGPVLVASYFLVVADEPAVTLFCLGGAVAGNLNWRRSQDFKRQLALRTADRERLALEVERLGVHDARIALARQLHEGLSKDLGDLTREAEALVERDAALAPELTTLADRSRAGLDELRSAVWLVEEPGRSWGDLVDHLSKSIGELVRHKATLDLEVVTAPDAGEQAALTGGVCLTLLRILQEAARNALTHGRAGRVRVRLEIDRERVRAVVEDDGRGAPGGKLVGKGGLLNMQTRAAQHRGRVAVASSEAGTRVEVELPRSAALAAMTSEAA